MKYIYRYIHIESHGPLLQKCRRNKTENVHYITCIKYS